MPGVASSCTSHRTSADAADADCGTALRRSRAAHPRIPARSSLESKNDLLAVEPKLPTSLFDKMAFGRSRDEGGVRIVDVDKDLSPDPGPGESLQRAARSGHRNMAHAPRGLRRAAVCDHLLVSELRST